MLYSTHTLDLTFYGFTFHEFVKGKFAWKLTRLKVSRQKRVSMKARVIITFWWISI